MSDAPRSRTPRRVLLVCPAFPYSFWSFEESCRMLGTKSLVAPLGLITVAALLPRDWPIRLADLNTRRLTEEDWDFCDTVMITSTIPQRHGALELIREGRKRGKTVVVGGPDATLSPKPILEAGCHFLVRGEGEHIVARLVAALEAGEPRGVFEETGRPDLSASPIPRYDLLRFNDYSTLSVQTSRGCPFDCEFCDITTLYGRNPRHKNPAQVIAELEVLFRLGWRSVVFISDDNFIANRTHAVALLDRLIPWMEEHGKPFSFLIQASINLGEDNPLIDLMTEANFAGVFVGVESPDEDALDKANKHHNMRRPLLESLDTINRNGLQVIGSFIMGLDGEKPGAGRRLCALVEESAMPVVMLNLLAALPHTRLWDRLKAEGRLREEVDIVASQKGGLNFVPDRPEKEVLEEYLQTIDYLYEPSRLLARAYRYCLAGRPTRAALAKARGEPLPPSPVPRAKLSLRCKIIGLSQFLQIILRQGIIPEYRGQFWRQLYGVLRRNPSRIVRYLSYLGSGEDLFAFRRKVTQWLEATLADR